MKFFKSSKPACTLVGLVILLMPLGAFADNPTEERNRLLAFVGSVQSSVAVPCETTERATEDGRRLLHVCFDSQLDSTFSVDAVIFGTFNDTEIDMTSFDHFGRFPFLDEDHVLMYVSQYEGAYFQQKYQYDAVYKTADGRWAGCGPSVIEVERYEGVERIVPVPIDFAEPVTFDLRDYSEENGYDPNYVREYFSGEGFSINDNVLTCVKGIYAEDLFKLRDSTILAARRKQ